MQIDVNVQRLTVHELCTRPLLQLFTGVSGARQIQTSRTDCKSNRFSPVARISTDCSLSAGAVRGTHCSEQWLDD